MVKEIKNEQNAEGSDDMGKTPNFGESPKVEKKETPKKKVEVDADVLKKLLDRVDKQDEQLKDLTQAADMGRLQRIQDLKGTGKLRKGVKISVYDGKYVLGWSTLRNDVRVNQEGKIEEDQQIELLLDAGDGVEPEKTGAISLRDFSRLITKEVGEVIKEIRDEDGRMSFLLELKSGRKFELPIVFLN
jgi:hypothetical protein